MNDPRIFECGGGLMSETVRSWLDGVLPELWGKMEEVCGPDRKEESNEGGNTSE